LYWWQYKKQWRKPGQKIAPRPGKSVHNPDSIRFLEGAGVRIRRKAKAGPLTTFSPHHLRSLKYEEVYLNEYQSPREARQGSPSILRFTTTTDLISL